MLLPKQFEVASHTRKKLDRPEAYIRTIMREREDLTSM